MRIAQIVCTYPPYHGGMGRSAFEFSQGLRRLGHQVTVFTARKLPAGDLPDTIYLRPFLFLGNGAVLPQLLRRLREYEVVHIHYPFFGSLEILTIYAFLKPARQRLFLHYHMDVNFRNPFLWLLSWPERLFRPLLFKKVEAITISSRDYAHHSKLRSLFARYESKLVEIPFGVDNHKFHPGCANNETQPKILFVGGLDQAHYFKGLELLFQALVGIDCPYTLEIVGEGDLFDYYQKQALSLGLAKKTVFRGGLDDQDLVRAYQGADILVLPSINRNEAFGLVLLEAMATGTPVIAADLPGVRQVFTDKKQGYYFKTNNCHDLQNKIVNLLSEPKQRAQMGIAGRSLVEEKYAWPRVAKRLESIYQNENSGN